MADATDGIQSQQHKLVIKQVLQENIETITNSVLDEVIKHKYAGSGHLTEEWIETVTSYMTCLRGFIAQLRSETTPLTYKSMFFLDLYTKSESATGDFLRRKREVAAHIMIGNQRRMGQTNDQLIKVDAKEIGEKRMAEMVEMIGFLSQNGHSQKWKEAMLAKIEEARAFIQQNDLTFEMKEAIQHLNFQYYRIRNAYSKVMAAKAAPETFSTRPSDYH
ncbi:hypothetical protein CAEBREN_09586 [Caenorhabditis brenneri]|uniref:Uncharacterized protein n=1 Tax=Caenorhabditis brenneri TaxID=135651 RepID=G0MQP6_CAEBE|nr:hypothetical protein CAEBREN_09586 [Caenorhabditis brenneri]